MKISSFLLLFCISVFLPSHAISQVNRKDSLMAVVKAGKQDTTLVKALNDLAKELRGGNPDTGIILNKEALQLSLKLNYITGVAQSRQSLGFMYYNTGKYDKALEEDRLAIEAWKKANPPDGGKRAAGTLSNMGLVYVEMGNFSQALENYYTALKVGEKLNDTILIATTQGNIGLVLFYQKNYNEAARHYDMALKLNQSLMTSPDKAIAKGAKNRTAVTLGNIGNVHNTQGRWKEALDFYIRSLKLREELGAKSLISSSLGNIGSVYAEQARKKPEGIERDSLYTLALDYVSRSLEFATQVNDPAAMSFQLTNKGAILLDTKRLKEARANIEKGLAIALELGLKNICRDAYSNLSMADEKEGRKKEALANYKLYIAYRDSLNNEENTKETVRLEMNYEFDKKEAATRSLQEKKDAIAEADKHRQQLILLSISVFGVLVLGFAVFAFYSFVQKRKANIAISLQKELIEEKQKEILDSIHYAKRIQKSLLTSEHYITKNLKRLHKS